MFRCTILSVGFFLSSLNAQGIPQPVFYKGKPEKILEVRSIEGILVVEEMVRGLNEPHNAAWMPMRLVTKDFADPYNQFSGYIWIISERKGRLWALYKERLYALQGLPKDVARAGEAGFFDVHYAMGRIFLSYAKKLGRKLSTLAVVSYALHYYDDTFTLLDGVEIFRAKPPIQTGWGYGGALSSDQEYLFIGVGDGSNRATAQDIQNPWGGIFRFPLYASSQNVERQIFPGSFSDKLFSIGHGNIQSLYRDYRHRFWSVEQLRDRYGRIHADELNLLSQGGNYGWGIQGSSLNSAAPSETYLGHVEDPVVTWPGGLGWSSILVLGGAARNLFHAWEGNVLLSALQGQSLYRFLYREDATREQGFRLEYREQLLNGYLGPLRWIGQGFDGAIYLLSLRRGSGNGRFLRLSPKSQQFPNK